jgi:two-component system OmpR family response regulator
MKLFLIEDDARLAEHLAKNLNEHGFLVTHISNSTALTEVLKSAVQAEFIILDRLLGSVDTKAIFSRIKSKWPNAPILVLSAISTPNEKTDLINMGADDYLGKPFSAGELIARVRALVRRSINSNVTASNYLQLGNLIVDLMKRTISVGDSAEILSSKEFLLFRALSQETGRIWSKNDLIDYVWGQSADINTNVVEATVTNVRKKLQELGSNVKIKNMRNSGYWLEA